MVNWDKKKSFFKQTYEDATYAAERVKREYAWRIDAYTAEAEKYGKWLKVDRSGGGHNDDMDAFRHGYTSAKVSKDGGREIAELGGIFHEVKGQTQDILNRDPRYDQPLAESIMDEHNNSVGRGLGVKAAKEGWSNQRLAREIKKALDTGKLIRRPEDAPNLQDYPTKKGASIMDYYGKGVDVQVRSYARGSEQVKAHTRSRPDGETGNNFGPRKKV